MSRFFVAVKIIVSSICNGGLGWRSEGHLCFTNFVIELRFGLLMRGTKAIFSMTSIYYFFLTIGVHKAYFEFSFLFFLSVSGSVPNKCW